MLIHFRSSSIIRRCCSTVARKIVFSGIQPTGELHLGNYFGAIEKWIQLQDDPSVEKIYISIVDLHAITVPDPAQIGDTLRRRIRLTTAGVLAAGLDPERCVIFQQSGLPQHCELTWILGCLAATMARLTRLGQYKERCAKYKDGNIPLGLFVYPVLQSADILLYKATHVPVGDDQQQHLVIARHLAEIFNLRYNHELFPVPERLGTGFARVRSLRDPSKKMSKSDKDEKSRIQLSDEPDLIREKLKKALTDMDSKVNYDATNRPAVANLIQIHSMVTGKSLDQICEESRGLSTGEYKLVVADCVVKRFEEFRKRFGDYLKDESYLNRVLEEGASKANEVATKTLKEVRQVVGFD